MSNPALAMLGLGSDEALKQAKKGFKRLSLKMDELHSLSPSQRQETLLGEIAKMPPETLALLAVTSIGNLSAAALSLHEMSFGLRVSLGEEAGAALQSQFAEVFDRAIESIREVSHRIKEGIALRIAEGFPEWDFDKGCVKGRDDGPPPMSNDQLEALFAGIDWGDL